MSLYGALYSAVSGMSAESSAMGAISDNISNINTTGYKDTTINFSTLVTTQVATTSYSAGGVELLPRQNVNVQGLLQATNSTTDMALSGQGMFVVNSSPTPDTTGGTFYYTRAGSFQANSSGYLENAQGYYLMGWPLTPTDNSAAAVPGEVTINGTTYMKAYKNADGTTHYINQNIIDPTEMQALNVNDIGGTAEATSNVSMGLNLPADAAVYSATDPSNGGAEDSNVLLYDTLGDTENAQFNWTKLGNNSWGLGVTPPAGAAEVTVVNQAADGSSTVYGAQGQIEFNSVPAAGSYFTLTDNASGGTETNVQIQFYNSSLGGTDGINPTSDSSSLGSSSSPLVLGVNLNGITSTSALVSAITSAIDTAATAPASVTTTQGLGAYNISNALLGGVADGNNRFQAATSGSPPSIQIVQEPGADSLQVNVQSNATTGLGTSIVESNTGAGSSVGADNEGIFTIPAIDSAYQQTNTGSTQNSFSVLDALPGLGTSTTDVLQVGTTQIPWSQILSGTLSNYTDFGTANSNVPGSTTTLSTSATLTYIPSTAGYVSSTLDFTSADVTGMAANVGSASTDYLDINGLQIPWSEIISGSLSGTLETDSGGTVTLANTITSTYGAATDSTTLADNVQSMLTSLEGDVNAGGYLGGLNVTITTAGTVTFTTVSNTTSDMVANLTVDGGAGTGTLFSDYGVNYEDSDGTNITSNGNYNTVDTIGTTLSAANAAQNAADAINALAAATDSPLPDGFSAEVNPGSTSVTLDSGDAPPTTVVPINAEGYATWTDSTDGSSAEVMGMTGSYSATTGAAITFNGDGTPATITPNAMQIQWANGSENQSGTSGTATVKPQIALNFGDPNESTGITQLGGDYTVNFITQDGAKFGNFSGLSIASDGVVTALFDNGVQTPVFQIPVATFANPDGLASDSGDVWNATSSSGAYTLRSAGSAGAATVSQSSLEQSTVDLGTEFTNMIVVQRAYSAATKIITTADSMMQDLLEVVQS